MFVNPILLLPRREHVLWMACVFEGRFAVLATLFVGGFGCWLEGVERVASFDAVCELIQKPDGEVETPS